MRKNELFTDVNDFVLEAQSLGFLGIRVKLSTDLFSCLFREETHWGIGPLHTFL